MSVGLEIGDERIPHPEDVASQTELDKAMGVLQELGERVQEGGRFAAAKVRSDGHSFVDIQTGEGRVAFTRSSDDGDWRWSQSMPVEALPDGRTVVRTATRYCTAGLPGFVRDEVTERRGGKYHVLREVGERQGIPPITSGECVALSRRLNEILGTHKPPRPGLWGALLSVILRNQG